MSYSSILLIKINLLNINIGGRLSFFFLNSFLFNLVIDIFSLFFIEYNSGLVPLMHNFCICQRYIRIRNSSFECRNFNLFLFLINLMLLFNMYLVTCFTLQLINRKHVLYWSCYVLFQFSNFYVLFIYSIF